MTETHFEQGMVELDEIDLGFCKFSIIVAVDPYGFTQQLGEYKMVKLIRNYIEEYQCIGNKVCSSISQLIHLIKTKSC